MGVSIHRIICISGTYITLQILSKEFNLLLKKRCSKDYKYIIDSNRTSACNPVPVGPKSKSDTRMNSSLLLVWKCWDLSRWSFPKIRGPTEFLYALFSDFKKKTQIHRCEKINWQNYWIIMIWGGCFLRFPLITNIDMVGWCNLIFNLILCILNILRLFSSFFWKLPPCICKLLN